MPYIQPQKELTLGNNLDPLLKDLTGTRRRMHRTNGHDSHNSLRVLASQVQRRSAAHRVADNNSLCDLQPVHQLDHIIGNSPDILVQPREARAPGAVRVNSHTSMACREMWQDREEVVLRRPQPVDEDERLAPGRRALGMRVGVVEAFLVDGDVGHIASKCAIPVDVVNGTSEENVYCQGALVSCRRHLLSVYPTAVKFLVKFMATSDIRALI